MLGLLNRRISRCTGFHCLRFSNHGFREKCTVWISNNTSPCLYRFCLYEDCSFWSFMLQWKNTYSPCLSLGQLWIHIRRPLRWLRHHALFWPNSDFLLFAGLMQLSCVHVAGADGGVIQDRGNSLKQLQRSEVLDFATLLLSSFLVPWIIPILEGCSVPQLMSAKALRGTCKASMVPSLCRNKLCYFGIK